MDSTDDKKSAKIADLERRIAVLAARVELLEVAHNNTDAHQAFVPPPPRKSRLQQMAAIQRDMLECTGR